MALMDAVQDALVEQRDLAATFRTLFASGPTSGTSGKKGGKARAHTRVSAPAVSARAGGFTGYSSPAGLVGRVGAAARGLRESYSTMGGWEGGGGARVKPVQV